MPGAAPAQCTQHVACISVQDSTVASNAAAAQRQREWKLVLTWRSSEEANGWYRLSPSSGQATADSWARIWWVRPVSSSMRHSWHDPAELALTPHCAAAASVSLNLQQAAAGFKGG